MNYGLTSEQAIRQRVLEEYQIVDEPVPSLNTLTRAASHILDCPIALITLVDWRRKRVIFKSSVGLPGDGSDVGEMEDNFCAQCVLTEDHLMVPDASQHPQFRNAPNVRGDLNFRFYCGVGLVLDDQVGVPVGTICVMDYAPRSMTLAQIDLLKNMGKAAVRQLQLRRTERICQKQLAALAVKVQELSASVMADPQVSSALDLQALRAEQHTEFVSTISHELCTPSNLVQCSGALLHSTRLSAEQTHYLNLILAGNNQVQVVLENVSHMETRPQPDMHTQIDVEGLLQALLKVYRVPCNTLHGRSFVGPHMAKNLPSHIVGDPVKISQILLNMMSDAVRNTEDCGGVVMVEARLEGLPPELERDHQLTDYILDPDNATKSKGVIVFEVQDDGKPAPSSTRGARRVSMPNLDRGDMDGECEAEATAIERLVESIGAFMSVAYANKKNVSTLALPLIFAF